MKWFSYSLASAGLSTLYSLSISRGVKDVFSTDFASGYSIVGAVLMTLMRLFTHGTQGFQMEKWGTLSGISQAIGCVCLANSLRQAPNPGLTVSIYRVQSVLTAIMAYFLFGSKLSIHKCVAMGVVLLGIYLVSQSTHTKSNRPEGKQEDKQDIKEEFSNSPHSAKTSSWLLLALITGVAFSFKDILLKNAFVSDHIDISGVLWNITIAQAVFMIAYDHYTTGTYGFHDVTGDSKITKRDKLQIIWTGLIYVLYSTTVAAATKFAPNVGYAKSVISIGMIATTIISHYLYDAPITKEGVIGMGLILVGSLYISLAK